MRFHRSERIICVTVSWGFYILAAVYLLLLPLKFAIAWCIATFIHELSHYIALLCCKVPIFSIHIGIRGAIIETEEMSPVIEILCALAGPLGGLLILLVRKWIPHVALCGFILSMYNLLPIYPLDGGRVLRSILLIIKSKGAQENSLAKKVNK